MLGKTWAWLQRRPRSATTDSSRDALETRYGSQGMPISQAGAIVGDSAKKSRVSPSLKQTRFVKSARQV
jgi:hypothetical protein